MFLLLYFVARWATQTDPQILRFLLTSPKLRNQYDLGKTQPGLQLQAHRCLGSSASFKNYRETGSCLMSKSTSTGLSTRMFS